MYPEPRPSSKKCANADRASVSYTLMCYEIVVIIRQISESVLALRNSARSQCPRLLSRKVEQFDVVRYAERTQKPTPESGLCNVIP